MGIENNNDFDVELNDTNCNNDIFDRDSSTKVNFQGAQEIDGIDLDFPIEAFTGRARAAVDAVCELTQSPVAMCCQGILAAMSTSCSMFGDVQSITGSVMPMAVFLMTIAKSGERKSAVDDYSNGGIHAFEKKLGAGPDEEQTGDIWFSEPTFESLMEKLAQGPGVGLLANDDATGWFSGHSMSRDQRGTTLGGLCQLFTGKTIKAPRVTKKTKPVVGVALTMHMMFQPYLLAKVYGDRELREQGLLPTPHRRSNWIPQAGKQTFFCNPEAATPFTADGGAHLF